METTLKVTRSRRYKGVEYFRAVIPKDVSEKLELEHSDEIRIQVLAVYHKRDIKR